MKRKQLSSACDAKHYAVFVQFGNNIPKIFRQPLLVGQQRSVHIGYN
jgi:hypothetical protein